MINYMYLLLLFLVTTSSWAQKETQDKFLSEKLPVRNEFYVGGGIHTRGFQVRAAYSLVKNTTRTMTFFAEFGEVKHPKERRQTYEGISFVGGGPKSFIYGKQNNLFFTRIGYGEKYYLSAKNRRLVSLGFTYGAGFSLGMVRPYYLDLIYRDNGGRSNFVAEKFNESNMLKFLNPQEVDGPSGIAYGWDELTLNPGFFLKAGLLIDWGAFDGILKDIEIGVAADFYFEEIPIMIFEKNTPVFVNLYINVHLGHRW
ncbi:hypothetical protein [Aureispira anguillae]|uniref:Outer membrane protein beta-barrel domain-containing protein n=1 Tax=Aureispira anguillae TaxID=2864201 RepID=A0A915VKF4_9BACT|nr:hypothetical protein [Aureispira anguillae]BDS09641.1 hypothetical protein AsAng_0003450 [Aureispira anguillae]